MPKSCPHAFKYDQSIPQVDGEVWTTYSDISGLRFGIIFAAMMKNEYILYCILIIQGCLWERYVYIICQCLQCDGIHLGFMNQYIVYIFIVTLIYTLNF